MMETMMTVVLGWILVSIPVSLAVGGFIAFASRNVESSNVVPMPATRTSTKPAKARKGA